MTHYIFVFLFEIYIILYSIEFFSKFINETGFILDNLREIQLMIYNISLFIFHLMILSLIIYNSMVILIGGINDIFIYIQITSFFTLFDFIIGGRIRRIDRTIN